MRSIDPAREVNGHLDVRAQDGPMKVIPIVALLLASTPAFADGGPGNASSSRLHLDMEVDPTAYVLRGYSVHVGIGWKHARLDLGSYGMDVPEAFHGNEGWHASFLGAGAKLQWFPFAAQRGAFIAVGGGVMRQRIVLHETQEASRDTATAAGVELGWRFPLPRGLYVTPWAGVSFSPGASDVMVSGRTFHNKQVLPFAAVHLGYQFR
jgi:hypothetical protein